MSDQNNADTTVVTAATHEEEAKADSSAPSQDPVKQELDRVNKKETRTEKEKAAYSLKKNAERAKELGIDPLEVLGLKPDQSSDDENAPVTVGMLKKLQAETAQKTALQLADERVQNEHDRELTRYHLEHSIKPSGDAEADFKKALSIVSAVRNEKILEDLAVRTGTPKSASTASGAPAKVEDAFTPTDEEAYMMRAFGLSQADIIKARNAQQ